MPIINTVYPQTGSNTGDATATAAQILSPYTAYVATGKVTGTIPSQGAQTITPSTSTQTIQSGRYLSGAQTILGDSNLTASNIKSGVSIFGVLGTLQPKTSADYSVSASSQINYISSSFSVSSLGTPNIVCINLTTSSGQSGTVVSGLYSTISNSQTQGTAYITYGDGNVVQVTSKFLSSQDSNSLTFLNNVGGIGVYLPNGYTFNGTYNIFVSFFA